jgi:hypothetical protein
MARLASGLWDDAVAARIIGKTVLVGITYPAREGQPERHEQFHGVVISADRSHGIILALKGARAGEEHRLPAMTTALVPAKPGIYRLKTTGEDVVDPDYLTTWTIHPPKP